VDWTMCSPAPTRIRPILLRAPPKASLGAHSQPTQFPTPSSVCPICCSQWQDRDNSGLHMLTPVILVPTRLIIAARHLKPAGFASSFTVGVIAVSSTLASIPGHRTCPAYFWLLGVPHPILRCVGNAHARHTAPLPSPTRISCQIQV